jgi:hypothetical protein
MLLQVFKNINIKIRCKNLSLTVVLCGRETRALALRKEYRLRVFEKRVIGRMFGTKKKGIRRIKLQ